MGTTQNRSPMTDSILTVQDFARLFGTTLDGIPANCRAIIDSHDFSYRTLIGEERDHVLLNVLKPGSSSLSPTRLPSTNRRW